MLKQFYGKKVNITAKDGRNFSGMVTDYFFPEDNESGKESIVVETETHLVEFYNEAVEKIEEVSE